MSLHMSARGLRALMEREGKRNDAYLDSRGIPTIGVGHTGPEVHLGLHWHDDQVAAALQNDLARFEAAVNSTAFELSQNQFDALVSFAFNVGAGAYLSSTLKRKLEDGDVAGASKQFRQWIIPAEIITRRAGEWAQFNLPDGAEVPARSTFDSRYP